MVSIMKNRIEQLLRDMNSSFNKGDIFYIIWCDGLTGFVITKLQYGYCSKQFHINNNTLYFCGRKRKVVNLNVN
jgi:hypothetical protein